MAAFRTYLMPVSFTPQRAAQLPLDSSTPYSALNSAQPSQLAASSISLPAGATDEVQPNQQFSDLWLRFVSSVAQLHSAAQDHSGIRKYDGPALNGAAQDVAIDDFEVDANGGVADTGGEPPKP